MPSFADSDWTSMANQIAGDDSPQQQEAELGAALDIGGEVLRVYRAMPDMG
jgi:hypothetical protein